MKRFLGSNAATLGALLVLAAWVPSTARAQEEAAGPRTFQKGDWAIQLNGGYTAGVAVFDEKFASGVTGTVAAGYYFVDWIALYADVSGYGLTHEDPETDAAGASFGLSIRHHLLRDETASKTLFLEIGSGIVRFDHEWPDNGTHTNFASRIGVGGTLLLSDEHDLHLTGGLRWLHISNGYRHGKDENPNYDGAEVWLGVMWTP